MAKESKSFKFLKILTVIIITVISFLYPFFVYYAINCGKINIVPIALAVVVFIKFLLGGKKQYILNISLVLSVIGINCLFFLLDNELSVLMYPVLVNLIMFIIFGRTLIRKGKSFIEILACFTTPIDKQTEHFRKYCRNVTKIWTLFFLINGTIAFITACYCSFDVWTLYNGIISYVLIGLIFSIEYLVRIIMQKREINKHYDIKKL